ncbi:MAG TPA: ABC transporter permease [Candidatus Saccharimonadales bacterium]|nr:ABC transporter permease [Candidatus Saccharimonadales bacterium]
MIRETYALYAREVKKTFRNYAVVAMMIIQPLMWLIFFGNSLSGLPPTLLQSLFHTSNYLAFLLPGELATGMVFIGMFSSMSMIYDKRFGFLKRMLVTKAPKESIYLGKVLGASTRGLLQIPVMMLVAVALGVVFHTNILYLFIWVLSLFLMGIGLASIYSIITMKSADWQTPGVVSNLINLPLMFTSTALFPSSLFPPWMQAISAWNPLTYAADIGREALFGTMPNMLYFAYLVIFFLIFLSLGIIASRRWLVAE